MELCSSIPFLMAELDEVRTGETGFQQQYKFWNSRQPLRNKRPNLFRFNFCRNVFCPIPPCVAEAVELVWTCQTGPAQCSHSSAWVLNYQQLTLHCCYITIKCKILLVPAKDQLSVQFLGDLHLQVVILPLTRFEKKTIQQQLLLLLLHVLHHRPSRALKDGREKAGHPQSHLAQELARSQRKVCNSFANNFFTLIAWWQVWIWGLGQSWPHLWRLPQAWKSQHDESEAEHHSDPICHHHHQYDHFLGWKFLPYGGGELLEPRGIIIIIYKGRCIGWFWGQD